MGPFREYDIEKLRNIFYGESSDAILRIPFVAHIDHFRAAKSSIGRRQFVKIIITYLNT